MKKLFVLIVFAIFIFGCDTVSNRNANNSTLIAIWANLQSNETEIDPEPPIDPIIPPIKDTIAPLILSTEVIKKDNTCIQITDSNKVLEWDWFAQPVHIKIVSNENILLDYTFIEVLNSQGINYGNTSYVTLQYGSSCKELYVFISSLPETCLLSYWTISIKVVDIHGNISEDRSILKIHVIGQ